MKEKWTSSTSIEVIVHSLIIYIITHIAFNIIPYLLQSSQRHLAVKLDLKFLGP
jgi:hypothetical protein